MVVQFCVVSPEIWPSVNVGGRLIIRIRSLIQSQELTGNAGPILGLARSQPAAFAVWLSTIRSHKVFSVKGGHMLYYALVFLVIALIAGLLGFGGIAFAAAGIAKILFYLFLLLFVVSLIVHLARGSARV